MRNPSLRPIAVFIALLVVLALPARADDMSRIVIPDDYKTCSIDKDCETFSITCDGPVRCCEYDAMNQFREKDVIALKAKHCTSNAIHPAQCTICEPEKSHHAVCKEHTCVYVMQLAPAP